MNTDIATRINRRRVNTLSYPTHSHLTMAWVEGGVLGGICWIYILALTFRASCN